MRVLFLFILGGAFLFSNQNNEIIEKEISALYDKNDLDALKTYIDQLPEGTKNYYYGVFALEGLFNQDSKLANFYFFKCIEQTNDKIIKAKAYKAIGDSFYSGDGLDKSLQLACDFYKKSANLGLDSGLFNYAVVLNEMGESDLAIKTIKKYIQLKNPDLKDHAKKLLKEWLDDTDPQS